MIVTLSETGSMNAATASTAYTSVQQGESAEAHASTSAQLDDAEIYMVEMLLLKSATDRAEAATDRHNVVMANHRTRWRAACMLQIITEENVIGELKQFFNLKNLRKKEHHVVSMGGHGVQTRRMIQNPGGNILRNIKMTGDFTGYRL